ncbi:hypothetical protein PInf_023841 [Phytophthora infestans]|nr:hypothetical protein PInf_023841 [Phytophthora infestans]
MVKYGRKRACIYEYLLDKGEGLVKKGVDNIVQRVKAEFRGGLDDDDACAQALTEFAAMDGNVATVDETDAGHSGKPGDRMLQHHVLENMVNQVAKSNPQSTIVIEATVYHYAMLYRLKPPSSANDTLIHAFCTGLCATNPTARVLGIESAVMGRNAKGMNESLKKKAQELVGEADLLMIPVNVGNSHCELESFNTNQKTYKTVLDRLSWDLAKTLSDDYEVVSINAPIQTDGHSCGFFVMLRLWRMVDNSIALDI